MNGEVNFLWQLLFFLGGGLVGGGGVGLEGGGQGGCERRIEVL